MDLVKVQFPTNLANPDLHAADLQSIKGLLQGDEQSGILICTLIKVALEVNLGPSVEVDFSLLIALAEHHALPVLKVHISAIQLD